MSRRLKSGLLSPDEVQRLITSAKNLYHRAKNLYHRTLLLTLSVASTLRRGTSDQR